jgi:DNA polymerase II large subunit
MATKSKSNAELMEIIEQMKYKLEQVKDAEKKMDLSDTDLKGVGMSVYKDSNDKFFLVELNYDVETGKAVVKSKKALDTADYDIALYNSKKFLVQAIFDRNHLNHNKEK